MCSSSIYHISRGTLASFTNLAVLVLLGFPFLSDKYTWTRVELHIEWFANKGATPSSFI